MDHLLHRLYGLSAPDFDLIGAGVVRCDADRTLENNQGTRRATRTPTLDGGAVVYDAGYSVADRSLTVTADLRHAELFRHLVQVYPEILVTSAEGAHRAVPASWSVLRGRAEIKLLLLEKISA